MKVSSFWVVTRQFVGGRSIKVFKYVKCSMFVLHPGSTNLELYIFLVELYLHSSISKCHFVSRRTEAQLRGIVQLSSMGNNIQ